MIPNGSIWTAIDQGVRLKIHGSGFLRNGGVRRTTKVGFGLPFFCFLQYALAPYLGLFCFYNVSALSDRSAVSMSRPRSGRSRVRVPSAY